MYIRLIQGYTDTADGLKMILKRGIHKKHASFGNYETEAFGRWIRAVKTPLVLEVQIMRLPY